ncbi:MAG: FHA domain-containing protein [Pyrinomonadaceae bacterium]
MSVLEKVRRWIDGDSAELVLEEAARNAQVKPRSQAEEFIVKIARAVEAVMQRELVPLPQGTSIIPTEYAIFLSDADDKEWQGIKRKGLEQGLYHILGERAKEIAGKRKLETRSFVLELRVDGTLEKGEVRVQHSWEDSDGSKTSVFVKPKLGPAPPAYEPPVSERSPAPPPAHFSQIDRAPSSTEQVRPAPQTGLVAGTASSGSRDIADDAEEMTRVASRVSELYKLEIWRNGIRQNVVPVFQNSVVIGRGSRSKPVDIALTGDAEISRRHLTITTDGNGSFWVTNEGRNPATIDNRDVPVGQRVPLQPGSNLVVCSYVLRVQRA